MSMERLPGRKIDVVIARGYQGRRDPSMIVVATKSRVKVSSHRVPKGTVEIETMMALTPVMNGSLRCGIPGGVPGE